MLTLDLSWLLDLAFGALGGIASVGLLLGTVIGLDH